MSGKIVRMTGTYTITKRISDKKIENNDLEGALNVWLNMEERQLNCGQNVYSAIAELYSKLERYDKSLEYWWKFLSVCDKKSVQRGYYEAGVCLVKMEYLEEAGYYFGRYAEFSPDKRSVGLNDDVYEIFEELLGKNDGFTIVSPAEKVDYRELIYTARVDARRNDYKEAIQKLKKIPYGSPYFEEAACRLSDAYCAVKKYSAAEKVLKSAIEKHPDSIIALFNLCGVFSERHNREGMLECMRIMESIPVKRPEDNETKAFCAVLVKDHDLVIKYYEKYLSECGYNDTALLFLGIAYLNTGKYKKARNCFSRLYFVERDYVYLTYVKITDRLITKHGEEGEAKPKYIYDDRLLPSEVKTVSKSLVEEFVAIGEANGKSVTKSAEWVKENREMLIWTLSLDDAPSQMRLLALKNLIYSSSEKSTLDLIKTLLILGGVSPLVKKMLLHEVLSGGYSGNLGISLENVYRNIEFTAPPIETEDAEVKEIYLSAYVYATVESCFTPEERAQKISENITEFFYNIKNDYSERDYRVIAAAACMLSGSNLFSSPEITAELFKVKPQQIQKYLKSLEVSL